MSKAAFNSAPELILPAGRGPLVVRGDGIEVEFRDGEVIVHSGKVRRPGEVLKIGDVVRDGPNKGWIYCETNEGDRFLVAPKDSGVTQWREAKNLAAREKAELPSREQLNAMFKARSTGALKGTFNETGSLPPGWYWSAMQDTLSTAWCQSFYNGYQYRIILDVNASVRCVRRCSVL